jgi:hypothetical protein
MIEFQLYSVDDDGGRSGSCLAMRWRAIIIHIRSSQGQIETRDSREIVLWTRNEMRVWALRLEWECMHRKVRSIWTHYTTKKLSVHYLDHRSSIQVWSSRPQQLARRALSYCCSYRPDAITSCTLTAAAFLLPGRRSAAAYLLLPLVMAVAFWAASDLAPGVRMRAWLDKSA